MRRHDRCVVIRIWAKRPLVTTEAQFFNSAVDAAATPERFEESFPVTAAAGYIVAFIVRSVYFG